MTQPQMDAARQSMAEHVGRSSVTIDHRFFDLDVARFLLQCAAITYERTSGPVQQAVQTVKNAFPSKKCLQSHGHHPKPAGEQALGILGERGTQEMMSSLHESRGETQLPPWANSMVPSIKYSTVSELNGTDSAFCGIFFDPASTWIVLAFKGTDPTEFSEWASDFEYSPREAGNRITGFGQVHGGFYDRLFTAAAAERAPFDTIASAVRAVADELSAAHSTSKINLFITGHSLGCAMASLAYATPSSAMRISLLRQSFVTQNLLLPSTSVWIRPRHMRTIPTSDLSGVLLNRGDVVATALPSFGDDRHTGTLRDLFAFAHLGAEFRMGSQSQPSYVKGGSLKPDTWVTVRSKLDRGTVNIMNAQGMAPVIRWTQEIPLIGRLVAHATTMYWDAITQLQVGRAHWAGSHWDIKRVNR
ncbi:hypothetical protein DACRYDRAFT_18877 [Dacryopinax primogenitus]|uniref:Fungal lipase-type domain-containing protein n=1 Tax=Dacryopinax primogenitus (strain DJM 731) TaxID=1858805 RepID=M5FV29_DACPD|nr:uncharacterized protein DACRYDRAFT_18877 [Dacryopinax primogenitus]EJT97151.1 hypothetical protein DACRYDRAFT_18877 [Dacryopinax primogenitus]